MRLLSKDNNPTVITYDITSAWAFDDLVTVSVSEFTQVESAMLRPKCSVLAKNHAFLAYWFFKINLNNSTIF